MCDRRQRDRRRRHHPALLPPDRRNHRARRECRPVCAAPARCTACRAGEGGKLRGAEVDRARQGQQGQPPDVPGGRGDRRRVQHRRRHHHLQLRRQGQARHHRRRRRVHRQRHAAGRAGDRAQGGVRGLRHDGAGGRSGGRAGGQRRQAAQHRGLGRKEGAAEGVEEGFRRAISMCGIVGYVGDEECAGLLVAGLRKLEYRGYDSAGVAVLGDKGLSVVRAKGKLANLEKLLGVSMPKGATGIGHTRWATHGKPSDENAHPHKYGGVAVVHNGIIENHLELKETLAHAGHRFSSETDTEIFAHLIADEEKSGKTLPDAVRAALSKVKGTYALAVMSERSPEMLVVAKNASPLVLGLGEKCNFVASDVPAILAHTRDVIFLEEGDFAVITKKGVELTDRAGSALVRPVRHIDWTPVMAEKNGHKHFMHKEIHEQARALTDTIRGRASVEEGDVYLDGCKLDSAYVRSVDRIHVVACGTSWHASLI